MTAAKTRSRKRAASESLLNNSDSKFRVLDDELGVYVFSDVKGIISALHYIREETQKDGQRKTEETTSSVASQIRSMIDQLKSKVEKDSFARALSKSTKECENCLKNETARFQEIYDKFSKEKAAHLQAMKGTISKFEEDRERLFLRYEQLKKKENNTIAEQEQACAEKIARLEESLKTKKQDDKTCSILKKILGLYLENASDEDVPLDD